MAGRHLIWPVSASFLTYFARLPDGVLNVSGGCQFEELAGLVFPGGEGLQFRGSARFLAHGDVLRVELVDPCIRVEHGVMELVIDVPGDGPRAVCTLEALDESKDAFDARLTVWGAELFGGAYPVGHQMAPVRISAAAF